MKLKVVLSLIGASLILLASCASGKDDSKVNILFLHHSTGGVIWDGDLSQVAPDVVKENPRIKAQLPLLFAGYNKESTKAYNVREVSFPKASPYGWNNYPYDYYNIWVKHAGNKAFMKEPTLEMLAGKNDIIIFKHCFPGSNIVADNNEPDINSNIQTLENYKLQYAALKEKMREFPDVKFILFTGAVQVAAALPEDEALRAKEFYEWVTKEWDHPGDNIYLWDLYQLQTEGGLYFKDEYAASTTDSHPNKVFAGKVANLLFNRIVDIVENNGTYTTLTGESL